MENIFYLSFKVFLKGSKKPLYSLFGIILGISVLIFSFALMDGYREIMWKTLSKVYPPILIKGKENYDLPSFVKENAKVLKENFFEGFVISKKENLSKFVLIRAIEQTNQVIIGEKLAESLNVKENDNIILVYKSKMGQEVLNLKIGSINKFGLSFIDESYLILPIKFLKDDNLSFGIYPDNKNKFKKIMDFLKNDPLLYPITFEEITKEIISPLKIVEWSIAFTLSLITFVSSFHLLSKLLMDMKERKKTFAILYALGMKPKNIFLSFSIYSFLLGFIGILLGIFIGYLLVNFSNYFKIFSFTGTLRGVYFVNEIILKIFPESLFFTFTLGMILILLISIFNYIIIKKIKIVEALRFE